MITANEKQVQIDYILQLIDRFHEDLYDKGNISNDGRNWFKIESYQAISTSTVTCDFVKDNHKRCGKKIHNVIVVKHTLTNEILKIGSTCSQKLLGTNSKFTIEQLEENRNKIDLLKTKLIDIVDDKNNISESNNMKIYTDQQKYILITEAIKENILPSELDLLLKNGVPLSSIQYSQLEKNIIKLKNEKASKILGEYSSDKETVNSLLPGDAISNILQGLGVTEVNNQTDIKDIEMITFSLIDYMTSTASKDKRKSINFKEIYRSIESNYEIIPNENQSIMNSIFETALRYLNNQKTKYKMLKCDFLNLNFIYLYL